VAALSFVVARSFVEALSSAVTSPGAVAASVAAVPVVAGVGNRLGLGSCFSLRKKGWLSRQPFFSGALSDPNGERAHFYLSFPLL
jgi:hypothetical protein